MGLLDGVNPDAIARGVDAERARAADEAAVRDRHLVRYQVWADGLGERLAPELLAKLTSILEPKSMRRRYRSTPFSQLPRALWDVGRWSDDSDYCLYYLDSQARCYTSVCATTKSGLWRVPAGDLVIGIHRTVDHGAGTPENPLVDEAAATNAVTTRVTSELLRLGELVPVWTATYAPYFTMPMARVLPVDGRCQLLESRPDYR